MVQRTYPGHCLIGKRATLKRVDECEKEMSLPVVNSPRSGQCGYEG